MSRCGVSLSSHTRGVVTFSLSLGCGRGRFIEMAQELTVTVGLTLDGRDFW